MAKLFLSALCLISLVMGLPRTAFAQSTKGIPAIPEFEGGNLMVPDVNASKLALPKQQIITPYSQISVPNQGLILTSQTHQLELVNIIDTDDQLMLVIQGVNKWGEIVNVRDGDVNILTREHLNIPAVIQTIQEAQVPIAVTVLMDMSGSMAKHGEKVIKITNELFQKLPDHTLCRALSFGAEFHTFGKGTKFCHTVRIPLSTVIPEGKTPAFKALSMGFQQMSSLENHQKLLIVITDGDPTDLPETQKLLLLKDNTNVIFYWVGNKSTNAEHQFSFIADHFIVPDNDPFGALSESVGNIGVSINKQSVIIIKK